jgi:PAS domain S-box-containing protein
LGVYNVHEILLGSVRRLPPLGIDIHLFDVTDPDEQVLLRYHPSHLRDAPQIYSMGLTDLRSGIHYGRSLSVADRMWHFIFTPSPEFVEARTTMEPWALLGGGLLMTAFLSLSVWLGLSRIEIRRQHAEKLAESEQKFRMLAEESPNIIFINKDGRFLYANRRLEELLGFSREEFCSPGFHLPDLVAPDDRKVATQALESHLRGEEISPYECALIAKDGKRVESLITTRLIDYEGELAVLGIVTDITERKAHERQVQTSLREKETLLREVHHRVKNNMQIITSLLKLQSRSVRKEHTEVLREAANRIKSMALVHEQIYGSDSLARVDVRPYVTSIAKNLFRSYGVGESRVTLRTAEVERESMNIDTAIPFGMILNELVSNALKHGFPEDRRGTVAISFCRTSDVFELAVRDDGVGIPPSVDPLHANSLGLQIVNTLVREQLQGDFHLRREGGTDIRISFSEIEYGDRLPPAPSPAPAPPA